METNIKQKLGLNFTHNKMELIPDNGCEIVHEDGKWYVIRKKEKYPKTYEECCKIMGIEYPFIKKHEDTITASCYKNNLIVDFVQLLICRDAYWKIAGDWSFKIGSDSQETVYAITIWGTGIMKDFYHALNCNRILVFPTAEMCDAFYDNFKGLIESCKELL